MLIRISNLASRDDIDPYGRIWAHMEKKDSVRHLNFKPLAIQNWIHQTAITKCGVTGMRRGSFGVKRVLDGGLPRSTVVEPTEK